MVRHSVAFPVISGALERRSRVVTVPLMSAPEIKKSRMTVVHPTSGSDGKQQDTAPAAHTLRAILAVAGLGTGMWFLMWEVVRHFFGH